jgi:hypothetical protein
LCCEATIGPAASFIKQSIERRRAAAAVVAGAADGRQPLAGVAAPSDRRADRVFAEPAAQADDHLPVPDDRSESQREGRARRDESHGG